MDVMQLRDKDQNPNAQLIADALGPAYTVYEEFMGKITGDLYALEPEWRYYRDGKAWLCKVQHNHKTVFWLSVWNCFFKLSFYFSQRNAAAVESLQIDDGLIRSFKERKAAGKLITLVIDVHLSCQLGDIYTLIDFKKKLK